MFSLHAGLTASAVLVILAGNSPGMENKSSTTQRKDFSFSIVVSSVTCLHYRSTAGMWYGFSYVLIYLL